MMVNGLVSAGVFFLVFFLVRMASHGGVGYGDIKMITAAALIFGVYGTFSFLLTSHVAAALVAIVLLICKKASRKDGLPFGPFFYLGYAFIEEIRKYAAIKELDEVVLNRLIKKIMIGEVQKVDGQKIQEVKIIYNFVGEISA